MAVFPVPLPEQEGTFDVELIRSILSRLLTESTESLESDTLEIKGWCHDERELAEKIGDVSACLANANGGMLIVGASNERAGRQKFTPCPHASVTPRWMTGRIHDLTFPPVVCSAHDVSDLLSQVLGSAGRNAFAVCIPKKKIFGDHLTAKGISRIRVGKECRPHFTAEDDRSKVVVPDLTEQALSIGSIEWGMSQHEKAFKGSRAHFSDPWDFLAQARLIEPYFNEEETIPSYRVSLAALLLFGKQSTLARYVEHFETILLVNGSNVRIRKNIVESFREI